MIWHLVTFAVLVYIARKLQQLCRAAFGVPMTPWWYEIGDAVNRVRPGTF